MCFNIFTSKINCYLDNIDRSFYFIPLDLIIQPFCLKLQFHGNTEISYSSIAKLHNINCHIISGITIDPISTNRKPMLPPYPNITIPKSSCSWSHIIHHKAIILINSISHCRCKSNHEGTIHQIKLMNELIIVVVFFVLIGCSPC